MKKMKCLQSASYAGLAAAAIALCYPTDAQALVQSDVVTAGKYTQPVGPSLVGFTAHPSPLFLGEVTGVAGDVITINGTLTPAALNSVLLGGVRNTPQYVIKLRHDRTGDGPKNQGDWFSIVSNGANTVTVNPNGIAATSASVAVGDIVQIEKLPTLKEVYGHGGTLKVDQEVDFDDSTPEGDTIYVPSGSSFAEALVNFSGDGKWYDLYTSTDFGDGSQYTFTPDQAVFNFNNVGPAYDTTLAGSIQCFNLSHFIFGGFNGVMTGFAAPTTMDNCGLFVPPLPGATFQSSALFDDTQQDTVYNLAGTSFDVALVHFSGPGSGWYDVFSSSAEGGFALQPATGYFIQNLGVPYIWREPKP